MDSLERACKAVGGKKKMAEQLSVGPSAISQWLSRGCIPPKYIIAIERVSGVSRHELRPDIYPVEAQV
jgi:DNA-binding transcriptional regulator YdaS (Cro superfamily)